MTFAILFQFGSGVHSRQPGFNPGKRTECSLNRDTCSLSLISTTVPAPPHAATVAAGTVNSNPPICSPPKSKNQCARESSTTRAGSSPFCSTKGAVAFAAGCRETTRASASDQLPRFGSNPGERQPDMLASGLASMSSLTRRYAEPVSTSPGFHCEGHGSL
eukprot:7108789-Prymnesium_polylepis.1